MVLKEVAEVENEVWNITNKSMHNISESKITVKRGSVSARVSFD